MIAYYKDYCIFLIKEEYYNLQVQIVYKYNLYLMYGCHYIIFCCCGYYIIIHGK